MTLLQDRPDIEAAEVPSPPVSAAATETWLDTTDHKRIGLLFVYASLLFLLGGASSAWSSAPSRRASPAWASPGTLDTAVRAAHASDGPAVPDRHVDRPGHLRGPPPDRRRPVAVPRSAVDRLLDLPRRRRHVRGQLHRGSGQRRGLAQPDADRRSRAVPNDATNLWIISLGVISIGFLAASASLFVTVAALRTEGMTMLRVPAFTWATLVASSGDVRRHARLPRRSAAARPRPALRRLALRRPPRAAASPSGSTPSGCTGDRTSTCSPSWPSAPPPTSSPPTPDGRCSNRPLGLVVLA